MPKTKLLYLDDSYLKESSAKVIKLEKSGKQHGLVLDKTIFYPQGGGQPSDQGTITSAKGSFKVTHVALEGTTVVHYGKLTGSLKKGATVDLKLNWPVRYKHMQWHTAGHILDEAVKQVLPEFHGIKGQHGINNQLYIEFPGFLDASHKTNIQAAIDKIIRDDESITTRMVTLKEIKEENIFLPFKLPKNKPLRLVQIGERSPFPDGGTQLKSTTEAWPINISEFEYKNSNTLVHYRSSSPPKKDTPTITTATLTLKSFQNHLNQLEHNFIKDSLDQNSHTKYLGKKGLVNTLAKDIRLLKSKDRVEAGKQLNKLKKDISDNISALTKNDTTSSSDWIDLTAPGSKPPIGHLHPISQAIEEISRIFKDIGFTRVRYPEIDYDYYVFESLNMPPTHPARDEWETFFIDTPKHPQKGEVVLTTHTSNGQIREMERVSQPPIRMLNIAKCYRRQQDVTHTAMFHQFEGLVIDKHVNIQHLKGTLDHFAKKYYGPSAKSRIRPFMFKFTEPSFEVDFSCTHCAGAGCRFCKSGWHEVGGAGMVHPNVLKAGGIDPDKYTGFAFGWGVERVFTLKPGLELDDIRPFYGSNLEFLSNF